MRRNLIREEVGASSGALLALALWELLSPWIHSYPWAEVIVANQIIAGLVVGALAVTGLFDILGWGTKEWLGWAVAAVGAWLFFSPLLLYAPLSSPLSQLATANDMIVGMAIFALGLFGGLVVRGGISSP